MHIKQHLYYGSLNLYNSVFYTSQGPNQLLNPLMPTNKFSKRFSAHFVQYEQGEFEHKVYTFSTRASSFVGLHPMRGKPLKDN